MNCDKYTIYIEYSEEDSCYVAKVLELDGCMAHGDTQDEALHEIQIAMKGWLEIAKQSGLKIPKPLSQKKYSGKLVVRIPPSLHKDLTVEASMEGVSLNRLISKKLG